MNKGVPVSGQMDLVTAAMVNQLLENESTAALLEITMTGPTLEFEEDTYVCYGGAEMSVTLNNEPLESYKIHKVSKEAIFFLTEGWRKAFVIIWALKTD